MTEKPRSTYKQQIGQWGERLAEAYLAERGYTLVARNVRTPFGELDLIMRTAQELVFVEVKARTNDTFGMPEASLTRTKRRHLQAAAECFFQDYLESGLVWRVDVISIRGKPGKELEAEVTWFENALA